MNFRITGADRVKLRSVIPRPGANRLSAFRLTRYRLRFGLSGILNWRGDFFRWLSREASNPAEERPPEDHGRKNGVWI